MRSWLRLRTKSQSQTSTVVCCNFTNTSIEKQLTAALAYFVTHGRLREEILRHLKSILYILALRSNLRLIGSYLQILQFRIVSWQLFSDPGPCTNVRQTGLNAFETIRDMCICICNLGQPAKIHDIAVQGCFKSDLMHQSSN